MSGRTPRLQLTTFDAPTDQRSAEGYKFSAADRRTLDRLLVLAVERHRHSGETSSPAAPAAPAVTLQVTGGKIRANAALWYRYALVDPAGQEQLASVPVVAYTALPVDIPRVPAVTVAAGTMMPGPYVYAISAFTNSPVQETLRSGIVNVAAPAADPASYLIANVGWQITPPVLPPGATGYNIYRRGPVDAELIFLASSFTTDPYVDDGSAAPDGHHRAPTANTTNSATAVTLETPMSPPLGWSVRFYRSYLQGDWTNTLLAWVAQTQTGFDGSAPVSTTDVGASTGAGSPQTSGLSIGSPLKVNLTDAAETTGTLPPGLTTVPTQVTLAQAGPVLVGRLPFFWVNEFDRAWVTGLRVSLGRDATITAGADTVELEYLDATDSMHAWVTAPYGAFAVASGSTGDFTVPLSGQVALGPGDALAVRVATNDTSGLQPDFDMVVTVSMNVQYGSAMQTYEWETT